MREHWAVIEDFPNYAVSSHGRVQNIKYGNYLKASPNSYGYLRVSLCHQNRREQHFVHQLVAQHFVTGWYPGVHIKHVDGDNSNNHVLNLRFRGGHRLGRYAGKYEKVNVRRVRIVETGEIFRSVRDCARYIGGDVSSIYKVMRGLRQAHMGYTFEFYVDD